MTTFEDRISSAVVWCLALVALLVMLTSCSAAIDLPATPTGEAPATATAQPSATATNQNNNDVNLISTPAPQCTVSTGIDAGALNLRTGPGTQYGVIRVLHEGEVLTVTARGAWLKVRDSQGARGYVNSRYCQVMP